MSEETMAPQPTMRERFNHEVSALEELGHQYQVQASILLRSGRPGSDVWFDAGLELKRAAERLRSAIGLSIRSLSPEAPEPNAGKGGKYPPPAVPAYPYARRFAPKRP